MPVQVLGTAPGQKLAHLTTTSLSGVIMNNMKVPESKKSTYTRNLSLLVCTIFTLTIYLYMYTIATSLHYLHVLLSQINILIMQSLYVKETPSARGIKNLYTSFKRLILARYPIMGEPSEEEWKEILPKMKSYQLAMDDDENGLEDEHEQSNDASSVNLDMLNDGCSYDAVLYNIQSG